MRVLGAVILTLFLAASQAAGGDDVRVIRDGEWNSSLAAAQSAARYTGRPLLVFFYEDWCGYCEQVDKVLTHPDLRQAMARFILVKTTVEENEAFAKQNRIALHHQIVMFDWSGAPLGRLTEFASDKDLAVAVIEAAAANDLAAGRKLQELSYFSKAVERFRNVEKISRDKAKHDVAKKAVEEIAERARRQLAIIKQMIRANRVEEALDALNAFVKDFPPDMGVDEARRLIAQLKSGKPVTLNDDKDVVIVRDPAVAATAEELAKKLFDQGMVYEWDKNYLDAVATYRRVVKEYPGTAAAAEAEKRSKLFLDDPATRAALARQQMDSACRRLLEMGELYERNGRDDEALARYRSILDAYPDSAWAAEALKRAIEIERRNPK